jgi:electron transport complex protein RnfC
MDIGCMMFNVGTCFAIADAVLYGKALIQRVVTITGEAVAKPQNVWALLGTPIEDLLQFAEYQPEQQRRRKIIMGGPMMGFTVHAPLVPVVKITNCILVPAADELPDIEDERPCIRCGYCTDACPAGLLPQQLYWYSKAKDYDKAQEYHLSECIECGACAYVCPSEIPLVQYYRQAKAEIRVQLDEQQKSEKAKQRFEQRQARLEADKLAREEKHRKAAEARKKAMANKDNDAKDKIAAALARAKAKRAQQSSPAADADAQQAADKPDESNK